jgi:DNA-binding response OmpR family regulator
MTMAHDVPISTPVKRILLAEDDSASRSIVAKVLRQMGYDVIESADGGRLLVAITSQYRNEHRPEEIDLIVTDVNMPVCTGVDILKGLRAAHWRTPIILVTAFDTPVVREAAAMFGADVLLKPLDLDLFEETVRKALARDPQSSHPSR